MSSNDAYLGGERSGGKRGRGSPGKIPIIAAVETTPDGKPVRLAFRRIKAFSKVHVKTLAAGMIEAGTTVVTDGLGCFRGVVQAVDGSDAGMVPRGQQPRLALEAGQPLGVPPPA